ncbi:MAG: hypothetical protein HC888_04100 [Candidatus Competibacteraceae bacterium]|nr:hypothetical protein [Candidatus Competibacteraceae bacterium]
MQKYLSLDVVYTYLIYRELMKELEEESPKLIMTLETLIDPGLKVLTEIEMTGIMVDREYLKKIESQIDTELSVYLGEIRNLLWSRSPQDSELSKSFNPNSSTQVRDALYLTLLGGSQTGPTDKETLQSISVSSKDPDIVTFCQLVTKYREQSKALGTYVRGLLEHADSSGRVHSEFNLHGTSTGRLSSESPNLQNIPVLMGPIIRSGFIARPGYIFAEIDYSQLELRVAALYSQDRVMIQAYKDNRDIHKEVASAAFGVPYNEVTYEQRYAAKYIDFGVIYGRSAHSLAVGPELIEYGWTDAQAQKFIDGFLGEFKGLQSWMQRQKRQVSEHQYVESLTGRRRRWPFLTRKTLGSAERAAVNTPIQGLASDFTLSALIRIHQLLSSKKSRIVSTVHDSILFEFHFEEYLDLIPQVVEIMKMPPPGVEMNVPLKVDIEVGPSWGTLTDFSPGWVPDWQLGWYWYHPESDSWVHTPPGSADTPPDELCTGPFTLLQLAEIYDEHYSTVAWTATILPSSGHPTK